MIRWLLGMTAVDKNTLKRAYLLARDGQPFLLKQLLNQQPQQQITEVDISTHSSAIFRSDRRF